MINPMSRWAAYGEKPDYAGLLTFSALPDTEEPAELSDVDAAVIGASMDDHVSDHPGTRLGPRAIRGASIQPGVHLEAGVDPFAALRVVISATRPCSPPTPRAPMRRSSTPRAGVGGRRDPDHSRRRSLNRRA